MTTKCRSSNDLNNLLSLADGAIRRSSTALKLGKELLDMAGMIGPGETMLEYGSTYRKVLEMRRRVEETMNRVHSQGNAFLNAFQDAVRDLDRAVAEENTARSDLSEILNPPEPTESDVPPADLTDLEDSDVWDKIKAIERDREARKHELDPETVNRELQRRADSERERELREEQDLAQEREQQRKFQELRRRMDLERERAFGTQQAPPKTDWGGLLSDALADALNSFDSNTSRIKTEGQAGVQQLQKLTVPDADILKLGCAYWQERGRSAERMAARQGQNAKAVGTGFTYNQQAAVAREAAKAYQRTYQRCLVISR